MDKIVVKNEGILEVPEGKKFWELPLAHYKKLVDKKGYSNIIKALTNLKTWNKNENPAIAKKADVIANKLRKEFQKDECCLCKSELPEMRILAHIAKSNPDVRVRQEAVSLLDDLGLGIFDKTKVDNFIKKYDDFEEIVCSTGRSYRGIVDEDLTQAKNAIDKSISRDKKDIETIKNSITIYTDDEEEEEQAKEYAVDKLKEQLLATRKTCKLNNLI